MTSYIKGRGTEVPIIIMYGLNHREQETKKETEQRRQQKENKQKKNRIKNRKRAKKKQNGAKKRRQKRKQRSKRQKTKADSLFLVRLSFSTLKSVALSINSSPLTLSWFSQMISAYLFSL